MNGQGYVGPAGQKDARWEMGSGNGRPEQPIGQRGNAATVHREGIGGIVHPSTVADRVDVVAELVATWLALQAGGFQGKPVTIRGGQWATHGYARPSLAAQSQSGSCWSPERVLLNLAGLPPVPGWSVYHGDAGDLGEVLAGWATHVYVDPPYVGRTGYGWDLERDRLLALAVRLADAGAVVAISEAEPLPLPGWYHVELTSLGRRNAKPEWLTMSRPPASIPAEQLGLWGASCP